MSDELHTSPEAGGERPRLSWFERVCAFGVQLIGAGAMIAVVNLVALPLSMAIAIASGVTPRLAASSSFGVTRSSGRLNEPAVATLR